jgi:hypothetical protein
MIGLCLLEFSDSGVKSLVPSMELPCSEGTRQRHEVEEDDVAECQGSDNWIALAPPQEPLGRAQFW